jgi:hypothetical protein
MDIYARRVSESGEALSWFCVATGLGPGGDGKSRLLPSVAYNAANDEYLVAWMYEVSSGVYEIWGRIIAWNGGYIKAEFRIIQWAHRSFREPRVAWNSALNEYLVVWDAFDISGGPPGSPNDIAGYRVSADGVVQNGGSPLIITTSNEPWGADLVYSAALDRYMVAWVRYSATTGTDIYGTFLNRYGVKITPPGEFAVYEGLGGQERPAVTSNEDHYMVAWSDIRSGNYDIYGRVFQADGSPVTAPFALASTTDDEWTPAVAANAADQYLTAWVRTIGGQGFVSARLRSSGALEAPVDILDTPSALSNNGRLAVACSVPGCLIAYAKGSPSGYSHIYGRLYWPQAVYLPLVVRNSP